MSQTCPKCSGSGYVQTSFGPKPCPSCGGRGNIEESDNSTSFEEPLIDTSDWWHDGSWIIYGALGLMVLIGLIKSCG
jgi:hypothetical protein